MLTFLTFFQALFLAILTLMFVSIGKRTWNGGGLIMMLLWPLLITCVILPATLPVLTLALDMSGYIGADQLEKLKHRHAHQEHRSRGMSIAQQVSF